MQRAKGAKRSNRRLFMNATFASAMLAATLFASASAAFAGGQTFGRDSVYSTPGSTFPSAKSSAPVEVMKRDARGREPGRPCARPGPARGHPGGDAADPDEITLGTERNSPRHLAEVPRFLM